jgi:hypothetical protein
MGRHGQIDHILVDRGHFSEELNVILFTFWWLQKIGLLRVSTEEAQKFDVNRFNFRKLSEIEVRKKYQIKISNKSAALENLNDREDINRTWENIKENNEISTKDSLGPYALKHHAHNFDEEYLGFLDQRKQAKCQ